MLTTKITIDGENYMLCIPPEEIIMDLKHWLDPDKATNQEEQTAFTDLRKTEWIVSKDVPSRNGTECHLLIIKPNRVSHLATVNSEGDLNDHSASPYQFRPMLIPLDSNGIKYRFNKQDFPNGSLTHGGCLYRMGKPIHPESTLLLGREGAKIQVGDTDGKALSFLAYKGLLFAVEPIMSCTPTNLIRNWNWGMDFSTTAFFEKSEEDE